MLWFLVATTICVVVNYRNCTDQHADSRDVVGNDSYTPGIMLYVTSFLASQCYSLYSFISTWNQIMSLRMTKPRVEIQRTALYHTIRVDDQKSDDDGSVPRRTTGVLGVVSSSAGCPICWETPHECVAVCQSCRNTFHPECLTIWLHQRNTCPCCRAVLAPAR